MNMIQELSGGGAARGVFGAVSGGLVAAGALVKAFEKVSEGEVGVRMRFGRAILCKNTESDPRHRTVGPGIHAVVPFTHGIRKISIQDRTNDLESIMVDSAEDQQLVVNSYIIWAVRADGDNPYKALFNVEPGELTQTVTNLCTSGLFRVMDGKSRNRMREYDQISGDVHDECRDDLQNYGVQLKRLNLKTVTLSPHEKLGERIVQAGSLYNMPAVLGAVAASSMSEPESAPMIAESTPSLHLA
jgi:regulator of protease activity HflC (stomatin/prohibitin superfamily)